MATNARTWFYTEPERRPYYIEERVNHTLWANRVVSIYLDCVRAEPPFRMEGEYNGLKVAIEWVPNTWFKLYADKEEQALVRAFWQVLQLVPAFSYNNEVEQFVCEWWRQDGDKKYEEIKGHPSYFNIKTYKKRR